LAGFAAVLVTDERIATQQQFNRSFYSQYHKHVAMVAITGPQK
jgi:hypothetical protein